LKKLLKELENKIVYLTEEIKMIDKRLNGRMSELARADGLYQNLMGQRMELNNRLTDIQQILERLEKNVTETK